MRYSVLDLCPVPEGQTAVDAITNTVDLARHAEGWGYHRHWLAEHHNMPGIASSATAILIGHVANATRTIRVGAGGIMLPNHSALAVAEAFGTLATIHGPRIDLGLGRAPGGDMAVARALGATAEKAERFPDHIADLMAYLGPEDPKAAVRAHPGQGTDVPLWILGSSLYGAQVAAHFGLPYAFASHFAPAALTEARETYRRNFRPSATLDRPHFMLAINVFAADTDAEGAYLRTTMQQAFARLRLGKPGKLPAPVNDIDAAIGPGIRRAVDEALKVTATGAPGTVKAQLQALIAEHEPDEVILTGQIHDHAARLRSFEIAADVLQDLRLDKAA